MKVNIINVFGVVKMLAATIIANMILNATSIVSVVCMKG